MNERSATDSEAGSRMRRLIPDAIYEAARRLTDRTLGPDFPSGSQTGFTANDEKMLPFLRAVADADERRALQVLASVLEESPLRLWHLYAQAQFHHLHSFCGLSDPPLELRDRVNEVLSRLIEAFARGTTGGYRVSITRPKGRRGQTCTLFPHLGERDGYFETPAAQEERRAAEKLHRTYRDLKAALKACVRWREVRRDYREFLDDGRDPTPVVQDVADLIRPVFERFSRDVGGDGDPLPDDALHRIVRAGLDAPKGRDPRHQVACALLATFRLIIGGVERKATPSLIESTLDTLRKHGIEAPRLRRPLTLAK